MKFKGKGKGLSVEAEMIYSAEVDLYKSKIK